MSGGGGSIAGMIASLKANKALRQARRNRFKSNLNTNNVFEDVKLEFKEVSKEELEKIRKKNIEKIEKQELQRFLRFVYIALSIGVISYLLFG